MQRAKHCFHPVELKELSAIVDVWVEATMQLDTRDLRMMARLVRAQDRLMTATPEDSMLEAMFGDPEFLAVSNG